jgi:hypothetical protein
LNDSVANQLNIHDRIYACMVECNQIIVDLQKHNYGDTTIKKRPRMKIPPKTWFNDTSGFFLIC